MMTRTRNCFDVSSRRMTSLQASAFVMFWSLFAGQDAHAQDSYLLAGAKVFTGGGEFQEGLMILIKNGKIAKVGPDLQDANAVRLDLAGRYITPGLVDANTSLGLPKAHVNEEYTETTPHIRILDAVDPDAYAFKRALENGVTTVYVSPGGRNVFGGLGVIMKTHGKDLESRIVKRDSGLRMTLGTMPSSGNRGFRGFGGLRPNVFMRRPSSRMGVIWEIRRKFYEAEDARVSGLRATDEISAATQVLIDALDKKITVRTMARTDQDIRTALRLAKEFGIKITLDECTEAYQSLDYIVAAKIPVIAGPPSLTSAGDGAKPHLDTLKLLSDAGVPVAIQTGQDLGALPLVQEAGFAVKYGMTRDKALLAVSLVPAEILGISDRVGSIEQDKDADIVVWSRHPLSPVSRTELVFVSGRIAFDRSERTSNDAKKGAGKKL